MTDLFTDDLVRAGGGGGGSVQFFGGFDPLRGFFFGKVYLCVGNSG